MEEVLPSPYDAIVRGEERSLCATEVISSNVSFSTSFRKCSTGFLQMDNQKKRLGLYITWQIRRKWEKKSDRATSLRRSRSASRCLQRQSSVLKNQYWFFIQVFINFTFQWEMMNCTRDSRFIRTADLVDCLARSSCTWVTVGWNAKIKEWVPIN